MEGPIVCKASKRIRLQIIRVTPTYSPLLLRLRPLVAGIFLSMDMISDIETTDIKVSFTVSRLLWSMLNTAFAGDDDEDALSFYDKELIADYEEEHFPIAAPTLVETIKLRMFEMGLTQSKLAEMLGLSTARISEIITGKGEPSLKTGREISRKLNIDPAIVLGV